VGHRDPMGSSIRVAGWTLGSVCPPGWRLHGGSCYMVGSGAVGWAQAQGRCRDSGAQLVVIGDAQEQAHLQSTLLSSSWLGIRDEELEGTWKRANGSVLIRAHGEPNGGQQENCAVVRRDGLWYDYPCSSLLPWVCEGLAPNCSKSSLTPNCPKLCPTLNAA
uniref:C-type lectin domain-containing protein n=1 Tax=Phasianus colchicus TaxID=9054 RepID=A0A669QSD4_PHACC